jgi:hypothetical protein
LLVIPMPWGFDLTPRLSIAYLTLSVMYHRVAVCHSPLLVSPSFTVGFAPRFLSASPWYLAVCHSPVLTNPYVSVSCAPESLFQSRLCPGALSLRLPMYPGVAVCHSPVLTTPYVLVPFDQGFCRTSPVYPRAILSTPSALESLWGDSQCPVSHTSAKYGC